MIQLFPNYFFAVTTIIFLIYSYINIKVKKAKVYNPIGYIIAVVIAILLLGMSVYGIMYQIPLGQVQSLIENKLK